MFFLRSLLARAIFRRLSRGRRRDRVEVAQRDRGYGTRGRSGGRFGFFGPVPYYSKQTRGGSRVSVGGCCLPLAVGMFAAPGAALGVAVRRRHRRR